MKLKIAILDMNEGVPNQGMRCIREIIKQWGKANNYDITCNEFEVRKELQLPGLSYDVYISSGGPGSPLESAGTEWETKYFEWIKQVDDYNNNTANYAKKHVFFICHSFQLTCRYFDVAEVRKRVSTAFGVFPVYITDEAMEENVFEGLKNPFYAVDSRDYQVLQPHHNTLNEMGGKVLAIEKERPHVPYERAVMAIRFNDYFIGTQFHPEADAEGMSMYLQREDKKKTVTENHGEEKWKSMLEQLEDPDKIMWTHDHVLPNFLNTAVGELVAG